MGYLSWSYSYTSSSSWSLLRHCCVTQRSPLGSMCDLQPLLQEYNQQWNLLFRFSTWDQGQGKAAGLEEGESPEALYRLKSTIALARHLCLNGSAQKECRTPLWWCSGFRASQEKGGKNGREMSGCHFTQPA